MRLGDLMPSRSLWRHYDEEFNGLPTFITVTSTRCIIRHNPMCVICVLRSMTQSSQHGGFWCSVVWGGFWFTLTPQQHSQSSISPQTVDNDEKAKFIFFRTQSPVGTYLHIFPLKYTFLSTINLDRLVTNSVALTNGLKIQSTNHGRWMRQQ